MDLDLDKTTLSDIAKLAADKQKILQELADNEKPVMTKLGISLDL